MQHGPFLTRTARLTGWRYRAAVLALCLATLMSAAGAHAVAATPATNAQPSEDATPDAAAETTVAALQPASDAAAPAPIAIARPVFMAAGTVEHRGARVPLAGVTVTDADAMCGEGVAAWPCGRVARTAVRRFVRNRTLECVAEPDEGRQTCSVAGRDVGGWLVANGWAKADGPRYEDAQKTAKQAHLGLWSAARPQMGRRRLRRPITEAELSEAVVRVEVSLSEQRMMLIHRGAVVGEWPVSTARPGKVTPTGRWRAQWLSRHHRSSLYNNAPMPYAVFFHGDYAIHGTNEINRLGRPASAGCVRLHPNHAAVVFDLARREGLDNTLVVVRR